MGIYTIILSVVAGLAFWKWGKKADSAKHLLADYHKMRSFGVEGGITNPTLYFTVEIKLRNPSNTSINLQEIQGHIVLGDKNISQIEKSFSKTEGNIASHKSTIVPIKVSTSLFLLGLKSIVPLLINILKNKAKIMDAVKHTILEKGLFLKSEIVVEGRRLPLNMVLIPKKSAKPQTKQAADDAKKAALTAQTEPETEEGSEA